jgi:hypothetical protein
MRIPLRREDDVVSTEPAYQRRPLGQAFPSRSDADERPRREVGNEAELAAEHDLAPGVAQPATELAFADQPLLPGVLRDPTHQVLPVGVEGVVVPNEDAGRGLRHPDHLA